MEDEENLLGDVPKKKNWSGRQESMRRNRAVATRLPNEKILPNNKDTIVGVSLAWLAQAFQITTYEARKKLTHCVPIRFEGNNRPIYHFRDAAAYLVKPKLSMDQYLRTIKPSQLPAKLQTEVWNAAIKRQKWEEKAGKLWRSEAVQEVFAETFKTFKTQLQLWPDILEREKSLSSDQRNRLIALLDELQEDLYKKLVVQSTKHKHPSSAHDRKDENTVVDVDDPDEENDDDEDDGE